MGEGGRVAGGGEGGGGRGSCDWKGSTAVGGHLFARASRRHNSVSPLRIAADCTKRSLGGAAEGAVVKKRRQSLSSSDGGEAGEEGADKSLVNLSPHACGTKLALGIHLLL